MLTDSHISFIAGLTIELNGVSYANNSEIAITEVGEGDAVLCRTDRTDCCAPTENNGRMRQGEWRYPNNTLVRNSGSGDDFYRTRGNMVVALNRRNGATQPTGLYGCEVATRADPNARICITLST